MTNLLKETYEDMKSFGVSMDDVLWIGGRDFKITTSDFLVFANEEYDAGYGSQKVATDLVIVAKHWWMERSEYDGSECWVFKTRPSPPKDVIPVRTLMGGMWDTLKELNEESNE